jgi:hypothetical protein
MADRPISARARVAPRRTLFAAADAGVGESARPSWAIDLSTIRFTTLATTPRGPHQSIIVSSDGGCTSWAQRASVMTHVWGGKISSPSVVPGSRMVTSGRSEPSKSIPVRTTRSPFQVVGSSLLVSGEADDQSATARTIERDHSSRISARTCSPIPWTKTTPVVDSSISGSSGGAGALASSGCEARAASRSSDMRWSRLGLWFFVLTLRILFASSCGPRQPDGQPHPVWICQSSQGHATEGSKTQSLS